MDFLRDVLTVALSIYVSWHSIEFELDVADRSPSCPWIPIYSRMSCCYTVSNRWEYDDA